MFGQIIKGKILDKETNIGIGYANVLIKTVDGNLLTYTVTEEFGEFVIELPKKYTQLVIEVSIISHQEFQEKIEVSDYLKTDLVIALKERLTELEEVYIKSEKKAITVKTDTTIFNINKFKDGTERAIEDVFKKLPGFVVDENGRLKFKGKKVVNLLLDGDNLFNSNYTIGTRNINPEIVNSIEAIEDYNENPLLKGVKSSENVAVNLVFKKGKADVSGEIEAGLGFSDKAEGKVNSLIISKKLKGFLVINYNNIGENYSPYNFVSNSLTALSLSELNQKNKKLINNTTFNSTLSDNRIRVNNSLFGSGNLLYKVKETLSLKVNYNMFIDELKRNELNTVLYNSTTSPIQISSQSSLNKMPTLHNVDYEFIYNTNKKSLLNIKGKFESEKIIENTLGNNNEFEFISNTRSEELFFNTNINYTYKPKLKSVFQINSLVSTNKIPQNLNLIEDNVYKNQSINIEKTKLSIQSKYITKLKNTEYDLDIGFDIESNKLLSNLEGVSQNNLFLTNNIDYKLTKPFLNVLYNYEKAKWQFIANFKNELLKVDLNDSNVQSQEIKTQFIFNPSFTLKYKTNKKSNYYIDYIFSNNIPSILNIYSGFILTDFRSLISNNFSFNTFNNSDFNLGYRINDFSNLFQFNIFGNYNYSKYGYVNQYNITDNLDFYKSLVNITDNKNYNFGIQLEKYIHLFKSTINFDTNYSINQYKNIVNNSDLRTNKGGSLQAKFQIRTGFKRMINFENKTTIVNNGFKSQDGLKNSFTTFQNDLKLKLIKDNFNFEFNTQYFNPDLKQDITGDLFLDAFLRYTPKNNKIEYQIKANNLLNKKVYKSINTSDFSTSIFQYNLQERFLLMAIKFRY